MFPENDDILFRSIGSHTLDIAFINSYFPDNINQYILGYKQGAEALINFSLSDRYYKDVLIYPIVFLYRQYLELRLKEIIGTLNYCLTYKKEFPVHHKLKNLWDELKVLYEKTGNPTTDNDFQNIDRLIFEFSSMDPDSMVFRYSSNKEGKDYMDKIQIDIRNFGEVMFKVSAFLDATSDYVENIKDNLPEY